MFRFDFYANLLTKLQNPAKVVPVFDKVKMQGEKGAVATVDMPPGELIKCNAMYNLWCFVFTLDYTLLEHNLDVSFLCRQHTDIHFTPPVDS